MPKGRRRVDRARERRQRFEEALSRGELPRETVPPVPPSVFRGWDDVQIPRALGWSGLCRGAQLLAVRLFSKSARGEGQKKARRERRRRGRPMPRPIVTRKGYAGRVERPRAYLAAIGGGATLRTVTNWLRQLEGAGLVKRQWKVIRASNGKVQGSRLIVWLRLAKWWNLLTTGCAPAHRAERNFRDSTVSPLRGEVVGSERGGGGEGARPRASDLPRAGVPGGKEGPPAREHPGPHGPSTLCEGCGRAATSADPCLCWGALKG